MEAKRNLGFLLEEKMSIKRAIIKINEAFMLEKALLSLKMQLKKKGVSILIFEPPIASKIRGLTEFEKERIKNWSINFYKIENSIDKLRMIYGEDVSADYLVGLFDGGFVVESNNKKIVLDYANDYVHIINGRRITEHQPRKYNNRIFIFGGCMVRGTGVEDSQTISSYLQQEIQNSYPDCYQVINCGIGRGSTIWDDIQNIRQTSLCSGDIVIIANSLPNRLSYLLNSTGIHTSELSSLFNRPHEYGEWFTDETVHTNSTGNKVIASKLVGVLMNRGLLKNESYNSGAGKKSFRLANNVEFEDNEGLSQYLLSVEQYRDSDYKNKKNGAIVMNCNPFTLGHKYLINYARQQVDRLYVFVVEEDKSFFRFIDRIELVRKGCSEFENVTVLPGGKFIISAVTFPGYFYKDDADIANVNCSEDVGIFGSRIAPAFNIVIRFAGEEPIDQVTRKYNDTMREQLPLYGVQFCEIPRIEQGNMVISASRVRLMIKERRLEELSELVPPTTYDFIIKKIDSGDY